MYAYKMYCLPLTRQTYYNRQVGKYTNWFPCAFLLHYYRIGMRRACGKSTASPTQRQESICRLHTSWILDSYGYTYLPKLRPTNWSRGDWEAKLFVKVDFLFAACEWKMRKNEAKQSSKSIKFYPHRIFQKNTLSK